MATKLAIEAQKALDNGTPQPWIDAVLAITPTSGARKVIGRGIAAALWAITRKEYVRCPDLLPWHEDLAEGKSPWMFEWMPYINTFTPDEQQEVLQVFGSLDAVPRRMRSLVCELLWNNRWRLEELQESTTGTP